MRKKQKKKTQTRQTKQKKRVRSETRKKHLPIILLVGGVALLAFLVVIFLQRPLPEKFVNETPPETPETSLYYEINGSYYCNESFACPEGYACTKNRDFTMPGMDSCLKIHECEKVPEVCALFYEPVCGNDNKTYSNACRACQEGVQYYVEGECYEENPSESRLDDCITYCEENYERDCDRGYWKINGSYPDCNCGYVCVLKD